MENKSNKLILKRQIKEHLFLLIITTTLSFIDPTSLFGNFLLFFVVICNQLYWLLSSRFEFDVDKKDVEESGVFAAKALIFSFYLVLLMNSKYFLVVVALIIFFVQNWNISNNKKFNPLHCKESFYKIQPMILSMLFVLLLVFFSDALHAILSFYFGFSNSLSYYSRHFISPFIIYFFFFQICKFTIFE